MPLAALELGQARIETGPRLARIALERSLESRTRVLANDAAALHDQGLAQRRMQRPDLRMARDGGAIGDGRALELTGESIGLAETQGRFCVVRGARQLPLEPGDQGLDRHVFLLAVLLTLRSARAAGERCGGLVRAAELPVKAPGQRGQANQKNRGADPVTVRAPAGPGEFADRPHRPPAFAARPRAERPPPPRRRAPRAPAHAPTRRAAPGRPADRSHDGPPPGRRDPPAAPPQARWRGYVINPSASPRPIQLPSSSPGAIHRAERPARQPFRRTQANTAGSAADGRRRLTPAYPAASVAWRKFLALRSGGPPWMPRRIRAGGPCQLPLFS